MDCDKALEFLDCIRPDSDDLELPEFAEARAHMDECESCLQEFTTRQKFDVAIHAVVQDVEIPESLQASLLSEALLEASTKTNDATPAEADADAAEGTVQAGDESADEQVESADEQVDSAAKARRGRLIFTVAAVACGIAIAVIMQLWPEAPEQFAVATLLKQVDARSGSLDEFDESFEYQFPAGWSSRNLDVLSTSLEGQNLDEEPGHDLARLIFRTRHRAVRGVLVAAPTSRIEVPPPSLSAATVRYLPEDTAALVWTEGDLVFAVIVHDDVTALESLREMLSGRAA